MNYQLHYDVLIDRAKNRVLDCYKESHHIIPKCMNGTDEKSNLVDLTAREHFIAHLLLMKIYPKQYGLIKAVNMMCIHSTENRSMNRMYGWLKEKLSNEISRKQKGTGNSQYGTRWCHNPSTKENKKLKKDECLPELFIYGKYKLKPQINRDDMKMQALEEKILLYREYYNIYLNNGFAKFKDEVNYKYTLSNFIITCKKLLPEYSQYSINKGHKRQTAELNSQYGTKFMFNEELKIEKRIKRNEIEHYISSGWSLGQLPIYCEICNCKLTKMTKTRHSCG